MMHLLFVLALFFQFPAQTGVQAPSQASAASGQAVPALLHLKLTIAKVMDRYVDPDRIDPSLMLRSGLDAIAREVPEVVVRADNKGNLILEAGSGRLNLAGSIASGWDLIASFTQVFGFLAKSLPADTPLDKIEHAAIAGILETLDPHTVFMTPENFRELRAQSSGSFGGLGIVVSICDQKLSVIKVMEGTPAARAGLLPGDRILRIGAQTTENLTLNEAVSRLRGEPGTPVSILVARKAWKQAKNITIVRESISYESVKHRIFETAGVKLGYIKLSAFQMPTALMVRQALQEMNKENVAGLVLDLRGNGGGLLHIAVEICDFFLDSGVVVSQVSKNSRERREERARAQNTLFRKPVVVLVDDNSASASEIVAGTLKYSGRAVLVGRRTFGKGSVQDIIDFPGDTALKITIAQYLTYGDISIQGVGIVPDIELHHVRVDPAHRTRPVLYYTAGRETSSEAQLKSSLNAARTTPKGKSMYTVFALQPEPKTPPFVCNYCGMDPDEAEPSEDEEYPKDAAVDLAGSILAQQKGVFSPRPALLPKLATAIDAFQNTADLEIAKKLQALKIDWTRSDDTTPAALEASLTVTDNGRTSGWAKIEITIKNKGNSPVHRLRGELSSTNPRFDFQEVLFGLVKPGETVKRTMEVKIPAGLSTRTDSLELRLFSHMRDLNTTASTLITTGKMAMARLQVAAAFADTDGDGVLAPGENGTFRVRVKNIGDGPTFDANVVLKNLTEENEVQLNASRSDLRALAPGEAREISFQVKANTQTGTQPWKFRLEIRDCNTSTSVDIPWNVRRKDAGTPAASAISGVFVLARETDAFDTPWADTQKLQGRLPAGAALSATREINGFVQVATAPKRYVWVRKDAGAVQKVPAKNTGMAEAFIYTPPSLQLPPVPESVITEKNFSIQGTVEDPDGVKDVIVSVTNVKANVFLKKTAYIPQSGSGAKMAFSVNVPLQPGVNIITITARDRLDARENRNLVVVAR